MKHIARICAVLACLVGTSARSAHAAAPKPAKVVVAPATVESGRLLFLSGAYFPSGAAMTAHISCLNPSGRSSRTLHLAQGIRTDRHGQFAGFAVPIVSISTTRTVHCRAEVGRRGSTPSSTRGRASATFTLVPRSHAVPHCSAQMCMRVRAFLVRLRNYAQGNITISGWPGAVVRITVVGPATSAAHRTTRLDWRGAALVRMHVAPGLLKGVKARVEVSAELGAYHGNSTVPFAVLPGIR